MLLSSLIALVLLTVVWQQRYPSARSMRDIAIDLSRSTSSLHSSAPSDGVSGGTSFNRSSSARSLNVVISTSRTECMQSTALLSHTHISISKMGRAVNIVPET